jgi:menaquinone-dependent protoporphyrinogen oxidase
MRVLVAVGSRHGTTTEIANQLAAELRFHGLDVDVQDAGRVQELDGCDAVVVGSAVYMGRWVPAARTFVERFYHQLADLPVWIFSSGPLGDPPVPDVLPQGHREIVESLTVRGDHVFAGRLDPAQLSFGERLITKAVHAPAGDFRDGAAVKAWAKAIATELNGDVPQERAPLGPVRSGRLELVR